MLAIIGRVIWVVIALALSALVCAFIIFTLGLERITHHVKEQGDGIEFNGALELMYSAVLLVQAFSVLPALVVVVIGEIARIRSAYYYIVCGGLAAASAPLLARIGGDGFSGFPTAAVWQVFATGGFMAGFVYWLLAGRKA